MQIFKKINAKTVGTTFFIILFLLIFFSKTLYTYHLPLVTATAPQNGKLSKIETASGIAEWADTLEIYAEFEGTIEEVFVREGERVLPGQALIRMSFDEEGLKLKLKEAELSRSKLLLEIEKATSELTKVVQALDEAEAGEAHGATPREILRAKQDYENLNLLYASGAVSQQEVDDALRAWQDTAAKYKEEKASWEREIKTKNLELSNLALQEESHQKTLTAYQNHTVLYAEEEVTVIGLDVSRGRHIGAHQQLLSLGGGNDFAITCEVSLENNFIAVGDTCQVTNATHSLTGIVTNVTPAEKMKKITVALQSATVTKGETFEVRFEKESTASGILVPNGAVSKDSDGYFLYQIKRRNGILGKEYYAEKLRIYIGDSDAENTVITKGVTFFEPIVLLSDKAFEENDTLKLKNEGDFFAS